MFMVTNRRFKFFFIKFNKKKSFFQYSTVDRPNKKVKANKKTKKNDNDEI